MVPFIGANNQYTFIVKESSELIVCRGKESERKVNFQGSFVDFSGDGIAVVKDGSEYKIAYTSVANVENSNFIELTHELVTEQTRVVDAGKVQTTVEFVLGYKYKNIPLIVGLSVGVPLFMICVVTAVLLYVYRDYVKCFRVKDREKKLKQNQKKNVWYN